MEKVERCTPKRLQGNPGNRYMERNVKVSVPGSASTPLEFELTRNQRMSATPSCPFTVTACFKDPPAHLHGHAWRVLLRVVQGRELLPAHVQQYAERALARSGGAPLDEGADEGDALPASSGADQQDRPRASPAKKSRGASPPQTERGLTEAAPKQGPGSASSATGPLSQPLLAGAARVS